MLISVFTPFHKKDTTYLKVAYQSLMEQTYKKWEWIILVNGEGHEADLSFLTDSRINIQKTYITGNIGSLKKACCTHAKGDLLAELDYDDILTADCLREVFEAFKDKNVQMAYSNFCEFHDKTWQPNVYSELYGWKSKPFKYKDKHLIQMIGWEPNAQSIRRIEWSPNHLRVWRKTSYIEIGGHDDKISFGDDHDLVCRTYIKYGKRGMKHIDKCLYLYRVHETNNTKLFNSQIQAQTDNNYLKYSRPLYERWADDSKLLKIDLGGRFDCPQGYKSVDRMDADIIMDLNKKWKLADNSVGVIRASHVFEHLKDPIHAMNEAFRVLAGGGFLLIDVPSTDGRGAFQDPTHVSFWNSNSFWYYTNKNYSKYISPEYKGRFQLSRIVNWYPNEHFEKHNIMCVQADLICLKPPYSNRFVGEVLI